MTSLKPSRPGLTFLVLAAGAAAFSMLQSLLTPVLPTLQADFDTTRSSVTWVLIAWMLSSSVATPILGKVGDMIGKTHTLTIALLAIALGSVIAALAPTIELVVFGRVIQGLGGAVFPLAFGIIRDEFAASRVPSAVGVMSAVIAVGGGAGMVVAGPVVDLLGWRFLFWLPMILVLAVALAVRLFVPESPTKAGGRINWLAAALLAGWLVALLLPLSQGSLWGWSSPPVIGLLILAALLFAAWLTVELTSSNPVIDMRMMRLASVWTTNLAAFLIGGAMFAVFAFLPQLLQVPVRAGYGFGATITDSGWVMLPMLVTMAIAGAASGPIAGAMSFKAQLLWGSVLIAVSCLAMGVAHAQIWQLAIETAIFGIGLGLAYSAMTSLIVQTVPATQTGAATGMNANIRTIGGTIGTAAMTGIVTAQHSADGVPLEAGFAEGFVLFAVIAAIAVGITLLVPAARRLAPPVEAVA